MSTNDTPDPVDRWATEHYGFVDHAPPEDTASTPPGSGSPRQGRVPRRRAALVAAAVLAVSAVAGFGGVAVAADGLSDGPAAGRGDLGELVEVVRGGAVRGEGGRDRGGLDRPGRRVGR